MEKPTHTAGDPLADRGESPADYQQFDIAELEKYLEARHKATLHLESIRAWARNAEEQIKGRIEFHHNAALALMARFRRETGGKQIGLDRGDGTLWRVKTRAAAEKLERDLEALVELYKKHGIWDEAKHTKTKTTISNDLKAIMAEVDFRDGLAFLKSGDHAGEQISQQILCKQKPSVPYTMTVELERTAPSPLVPPEEPGGETDG